MISCPTALIEAPVPLVWQLLTHPARWSEFFDVRVLRVEPPGASLVGQRVYAESGPKFLHLRVRFEFTEIDAPRGRLGMIVLLPLGITVREDMSCTAVGEAQTRVAYHCNFSFRPGWRGALTRLILHREFTTGPADSLSRLKRAAEQRAAPATLL